MDRNSPGIIRGKSLQAMTTEELEELLCQEQDTEGVPDVDRITAILAALDARREAPHVDVDAAWDDFQKNHISEEPLYPMLDTQMEAAREPSLFDAGTTRGTDADTMRGTVPEAMPAPVPAKRKYMLRIAVAAALILIVGTTVSSSAFGLKLWDVIAEWTSETLGLGFGNSERTTAWNPELADLSYAVMYLEYHPQIAPRYLPDDYKQVLLVSDDNTIVAQYDSQDDSIFIQLHKIDWDSGHKFERDYDSMKEYVSGGITHYISTNLGKYLAVWQSDGWECSISGVSSEEELLQMIDSIYLEE